MPDHTETMKADQVTETGVSEPSAVEDAAGYDRSARIQLWLIISGFVMMFLASLLMWVRFGPSMFVDLATAVANCF